MPFGGQDWLALTSQSALEPEIPSCDPHHHIWDVRSERMPYQCYLLHELAADMHSGHNVHSPVFIEARAMYRVDGAEEMRRVGEVEFVRVTTQQRQRPTRPIRGQCTRAPAIGLDMR